MKPGFNLIAIFPTLGDQVLPAGLKGLFLCGMVGTVLSALVGYTLVAGASFGREIVARVQPTDDQGVKKWTRVGFLLSTVLAIVLALNIPSVVALWYGWAGAVVGAVLLPMWLAYRGRANVSDWVVATSMIVSFLISAAWLGYGIRTKNEFLTVVLFEQRFGLGTLSPGLVVSAIILGIGRLTARREKI
ncbi:hypothetical protein EON80_01320 [bacterium]|nr:MAG: hypothetical protein EON80_01320 [bacterium]